MMISVSPVELYRWRKDEFNTETWSHDLKMFVLKSGVSLDAACRNPELRFMTLSLFSALTVFLFEGETNWWKKSNISTDFMDFILSPEVKGVLFCSYIYKVSLVLWLFICDLKERQVDWCLPFFLLSYKSSGINSGQKTFLWVKHCLIINTVWASADFRFHLKRNPQLVTVITLLLYN